MRYICRLFLLSTGLFVFFNSNAQQASVVDSLKAVLPKLTVIKERASLLDNLSRTLMNVNPQEADEYGKQLIVLAEESRDRKLMIDAYKSNGLRYSYFGGQKEYVTKSIEYYNKALAIARQNKIEAEIGGIQLRLAAVHLFIPDKDKALSYVNEAFSLISTLRDDSLKIESHNTYGMVYLSRNEKTLALRHYLNGLRIAEDIKTTNSDSRRMKNTLQRNCYLYLSDFYRTIEDYDKAIDYSDMAYKKLDDIKEGNVRYQRVVDINNLGNLFASKKSYDIAISYFERSIKMADSLKFSTLKLPGYVSLLNQYLRMEQPQKALNYMNSAEGEELKKFLTSFRLSGVIYQAYAVIYTETGQYDSARMAFEKATPYFEKGASEANKITFYRQVASFYKKTGDNNKAIEYLLKVKEMGERLGQLEAAQNASKHLDSLYAKTGNFQLASQYNAAYYKYKDSIETLNREKELTQVEAADEQLRQERIAKEKLDAKQKRDNIQYLAITIGIVGLFLLMVMMGMFKVSATTIKMIGFFAFLMFFEFIFLIFKKNIYGLTKGEPWKDLLFMIALAAILLPLHHWLEHKVIHYLTSHNRLTSSGKGLLNRVLKRNKPTV